MSWPTRLIADIGGTNARFALSDERGAIHHVWHELTSAHESFDAALAAYLGRIQKSGELSSAVIAAAGPVLHGEIKLTNSGWTVSADRLARDFGSSVRVGLVNDLEAVAHALPHLGQDHLSVSDVPLRPLAASKRMLVVNVGTGFGAACLIRAGGGWISAPTEAGHMMLGALDAEELGFFERVGLNAPTIEDLLSGEGVRRIASLYLEHRVNEQPLRVETATHPGIDEGASADFDLADGSAAAGETIERLTAIMARVCSNLVLASAAWDGIYMCGSVANAWWQHADRRAFRRMFAGHSKMQRLLDRTPVALITLDDPALLGLANFRFPDTG